MKANILHATREAIARDQNRLFPLVQRYFSFERHASNNNSHVLRTIAHITQVATFYKVELFRYAEIVVRHRCHNSVSPNKVDSRVALVVLQIAKFILSLSGYCAWLLPLQPGSLPQLHPATHEINQSAATALAKIGILFAKQPMILYRFVALTYPEVTSICVCLRHSLQSRQSGIGIKVHSERYISGIYNCLSAFFEHVDSTQLKRKRSRLARAMGLFVLALLQLRATLIRRIERCDLSSRALERIHNSLLTSILEKRSDVVRALCDDEGKLGLTLRSLIVMPSSSAASNQIFLVETNIPALLHSLQMTWWEVGNSQKLPILQFVVAWSALAQWFLDNRHRSVFSLLESRSVLSVIGGSLLSKGRLRPTNQQVILALEVWKSRIFRQVVQAGILHFVTLTISVSFGHNPTAAARAARELVSASQTSASAVLSRVVDLGPVVHRDDGVSASASTFLSLSCIGELVSLHDRIHRPLHQTRHLHGITGFVHAALTVCSRLWAATHDPTIIREARWRRVLRSLASRSVVTAVLTIPAFDLIMEHLKLTWASSYDEGVEPWCVVLHAALNCLTRIREFRSRNPHRFPLLSTVNPLKDLAPIMRCCLTVFLPQLHRILADCVTAKERRSALSRCFSSALLPDSALRRSDLVMLCSLLRVSHAIHRSCLCVHQNQKGFELIRWIEETWI